MSMISEQVKRLRDYASGRKGEIADICNEAASTIEMLSAKCKPIETETWNGYSGAMRITAPKGTFKKIYDDAEPFKAD